MKKHSQQLGTASPIPTIRASGGGRFFHLSGETVSRVLETDSLQEFLDRLFSVNCVRSVEINPEINSVRLRFAPGETSYTGKIQQLSKAMRTKRPPTCRFVDWEKMPEKFLSQTFEVWKIGTELSLWSIELIGHKDYRLWHPLLREEAVRERVMDRLSIADVIPQPRIFKSDESIKIHCHSEDLKPPLLKEILDAALQGSHESEEEEEEAGRIPREPLLHVNLALSPISDYIFPPLGVANAAMVCLINAGHWPKAIEGIRDRKANLHLAYLTIGGLTLLSFEFFAASSMYWLLHYWPKWTKQLRRKSQRRLLSHYQRIPTRAHVEKDGELVEVSLQSLPIGSEIILQKGNVIPCDGTVSDGTASVDESWTLGQTKPIEKSAGDPLYASTRILGGSLRMRLEAHGVNTQAAKLAAWHRHHMAQPRPPRDSDAKKLGDTLALPTLVLGALAFARGGVHMAKSVMRPDHVTGSWLTEELVDLQAMKKLAPSGIVVLQPDVLHHAAEADCAIFDDSVIWNPDTSGGRSITDSLKELGVNEVIFLSEHSGKEASRLSKAWGFDHFEAEMHSGEKMAFITQRRHLGRKVIYFGDCQKDPQVASQADIAITVAQPPYPEFVHVPVALLQPNLIHCLEFMSVSLDRTKILQNALTTTLVPNIIAIAGGLYLHSSVGTTVILTNLGTLASYLRMRKAIL